ncbi:MAG TPA: hypothetical protein VFR37_21290 [Longimicrobium sp.]|nr:hypothetical protein [Longimicrobium sp.]
MHREDEGGERPRDQWVRAQEEAVGRVQEPSRGPGTEIRVEPPRGGGAADGEREVRRDPGAIRTEDTEPYIGLQYVARLFKIVAMIVVVAIIAEVVAGFMYEGAGAAFNLLAEVIQGGVLAAMLWGAGDLTLLFIDVGHDVRAARVLLGRMSARMGMNPGDLMPRRDRDGDDLGEPQGLVRKPRE